MCPVHTHCAGKSLCEMNKVEQIGKKNQGKKSCFVFQLNQLSKSQQQYLREPRLFFTPTASLETGTKVAKEVVSSSVYSKQQQKGSKSNFTNISTDKHKSIYQHWKMQRKGHQMHPQNRKLMCFKAKHYVWFAAVLF